MQRICAAYKRVLAVLFIAATIICLSISALADTNTGSCEYNYVTDIKVETGYGTVPDYNFATATTKYDLNVYRAGSLGFTINISSNKPDGKTYLYYRAYLDDVAISKNPYKFNNKSRVANIEIGSIECGQHVLAIRVGYQTNDNGIKDVTKEYDEYIYNLTIIPGFQSIEVWNGEDKLTLNPEYSTDGNLYSYKNFTAAVDDTNKITVKLSYYDNSGNTSCSICNEEAKIEGKESTTVSVSKDITLSEANKVENSPAYKIPIALEQEVNGKKYRTENNIYVVDSSLAKPVITQQPEDITCDKSESIALSVKASAPAGAELSYQWYSDTNLSAVSSEKIEGAINDSYVIDTSLAGTKYYYCVVTSTVNIEGVGELGFTEKSNVATVKTNLSYVSKPIILKQLGAFVPNTGNPFGGQYRTEYTSGEQFDMAYISVEKPEDGVHLTYDYFYNTVDDYSTAQPLDINFGTGLEATSDGKTHIIKCAQPKEGFEKGEYYIFCKVTASASGLESASTVSSSLHLTYSDITLTGFEGSGTKDDPYRISTVADLENLRKIVWDGQWCSGVQFKLMNDITLPDNWTPIGDKDKSFYNPTTGRDIHAFSGVLDGDGHTLTVATGGKPLFNYVSGAVIKNLKIYGEKIDGNGLIDKSFADYGSDGNYWTGVPDCVTIQNVTLLQGSSTLKSGFMEGSGSGANTITIENCVVEDGVTIGYDKQQSQIGSFVGGAFNGQINNSYSEADVYGVKYVGGLAGKKGQSMGLCQFVNSHFSGTINAGGEWVGGLIASGYVSESAPNTMAVSFMNCYVDADITGKNYVGGLFGGEEGLKSALNDCYLTDSHFYGKLTATDDNAVVGGIVAYYGGINLHQHIENNWFYETTGKNLSLIGEVGKYWYTDAEKETVIANMGSVKTAEEFKDGTVLKLLNDGSDYKNWVQGDAYPVFSGEPYVSSLSVSGNFKTSYKQGEALDLSGIVFAATWSTGRTENPTLDNVKQETTFDPNRLGQQTITFSYGAGKAEIIVNVTKEYTEQEQEKFGTASVTLSVSDDVSFKSAACETIQNVKLDVKYFDLAAYDLSDYYQYDEDGDLIEKPTVLHLFITALERFELGLDEDECGQGELKKYPNLLTVEGGSGHMYMTKFWGHDQNLIYSVNGTYPLQSEGIGATADQIFLKDGDFVDVAMFTDTSFYTGDESGMHYFSEDGKTPQRTFSVVHDEDLTLTYLLAHVAMSGNYSTTFTPVAGETTVYIVSPDSAETTQQTDANGSITLNFNQVGEWTIRTAGSSISAPACATINVTLNEVEQAEELMEDLVDAEITLDSKEAIKAAREAYDILTEQEKQQLNEQHPELLPALEAAEAEYAALKQQQEEEEEREHNRRSHGGTTNYYVVHTYINGEGAIDPCGTTGNVMVRSGKSKTFTFTPAAGYEVADVLVNNKSVGAVTSYTFTNVDHDKNLEVTFVKSSSTAAASSVITDTPAVKNPNTGAGI